MRLKCYQRLGYFPKLDIVPAVVIDHVRAAIELPEDIEAETDADRTAKRHREFVRKYLGVKYEASKVRSVAEAAIRTAVQTKDNPADLINVALEELVRASCELPGYTTLDAMAATIRTEVNTAFFEMVATRPERSERARLDRLLVVDPATRRSEFDRTKTPAQSVTLGKFKARLAHLQALDAVGPTEVWLRGVPPGKVVHFAGEARMAGVDDMRKTGDAKRVTLLISLVHQQRIAARDEVVTMFCKRMAALHKKGKERMEELREASRAETERLIGVLGDVLAGTREATAPPETSSGGDGSPPSLLPTATDEEVAERAGRSLLKTLESTGGLEQLSAAHEAVSAYHGNNYLPLLEGFYRSHPANTDLTLEDGKPTLKRRKGADRRPSALALEQAVHQRLPERSLLDILTRAAYLTGWPRHLGPASGSDPKIRGDALGRYVLTAYAYGEISAPPRSPGTYAARSPRTSSTPRATNTPPPTRSTSARRT